MTRLLMKESSFSCRFINNFAVVHIPFVSIRGRRLKSPKHRGSKEVVSMLTGPGVIYCDTR